MKRFLICIVSLVIIIMAIILAIFVFNKIKYTKEEKNNNLIVSEKIVDECTDEWNILNNNNQNNIMETNSDVEKISPNCMIVIRKKYNKCGHTINEYIDIPEKLINKTKTDLEQEYNEYKIEKYTPTEIILYKEYEGECGEHFILRESEDNKIIIYRINENNQEILYKETDISIDYITETDKINIKNGLNVYGIEELNQVIEDFE